MKNFMIKAEFFQHLGRINQLVFCDIVEIVDPYETSLDKDCAEFTRDEWEQCFATSDNHTSQFNTQAKLIMQKYIDYAMNQTLPSNEIDIQVPVIQTGNVMTSDNDLFDVLDMRGLYTEAEIKQIITKDLISVYDKMFIQAIYEGIDFYSDFDKFLEWDISWCHIQQINDSTIYFVQKPSSSDEINTNPKTEISKELFDLLVDGANTIEEYRKSGRGEKKRKIIDKQYRGINGKRCFKRFKMTADMSDNKKSGTIRQYFLIIQRSQTRNYKFTISNIRVSGFFKALKMIGVTDILDPTLLQNEKVLQVCTRFNVPTNISGYERFIGKYLLAPNEKDV